jgi:hypothetical protein
VLEPAVLESQTLPDDASRNQSPPNAVTSQLIFPPSSRCQKHLSEIKNTTVKLEEAARLHLRDGGQYFGGPKTSQCELGPMPAVERIEEKAIVGLG